MRSILGCYIYGFMCLTGFASLLEEFHAWTKLLLLRARSRKEEDRKYCAVQLNGSASLLEGAHVWTDTW